MSERAGGESLASTQMGRVKGNQEEVRKAARLLTANLLESKGDGAPRRRGEHDAHYQPQLG